MEINLRGTAMERNILAVICACSLLVACSNSVTNSNIIPVDSPAPSITISSNNGILVAQVSYGAALESGNLGDLGGDTGVIVSGPAGVSKVDGSFAAPANTGASGSVSQIPIPPTTTQCAVSGSVTFSGEIADPFTPTLTSGDFFESDYNICDQGLGEVTNGLVRAVVDIFAGDYLSGLYDLSMTFTLTTLQVSTAVDVLTSNGDVSVTFNTANSPAVFTSISGNSLTIDSNASSESLTNFATTLTLDGNFVPAPFTMTTSGTLDSTQLSGVVRYSTEQIFQGFEGDFPDSGEFLVVGVNSSLRLIAENNVNVRIEIDTDGDGIVDQTINTTWAALTG